MIADGHILIFVRHAERGRIHPIDDLDPLIPAGIEMSRRAGEWLRLAGHTPTKLVHTRKLRTKETAQVMVSCFGPECAALPMVKVSGGPVEPDTWEAFASTHGSGALLVAHEHTQRFVNNAFCKKEQRTMNKAAVYVLKKAGDTWKCIAHHPGED